MSTKSVILFESQMDKEDKISSGVYKATTAKRISLVIPAGVRIYDTDLKKFFMGDGVQNGGHTEAARLAVRTVPIAAANGTITVTLASSSFTWAAATHIRTGDAITVAAGSGTIPTGLTATTYWIIKNGDIGDGKSNAGTTFKLASSRANAIARTSVAITDVGVAGFTFVISGVAAQGTSDVLLISPVSAAVDVYLPYSNNAKGFSTTIKRAPTATNAVTVKEIDSDNSIKATGSVTIDGTAAWVVLKAGTYDYLEIFADDAAGVYWTRGRQTTA